MGEEKTGDFSVVIKLQLYIRLISSRDWLYNIGHIANIGCSLKDSRSLATCSYR